MTVRDTSGKSVTAYKKGVWALDPGEYSYTVNSTLYKSLQGSFTVTEQERGQSKVISAKMTDRLYMVLLDVQPAVLHESGDATITLKNERRDHCPQRGDAWRIPPDEGLLLLRSRGGGLPDSPRRIHHSADELLYRHPTAGR